MKEMVRLSARTKAILVMGKAAREYRAEQRAEASPDLQRAINRIWQRILDEDR